MKPETILDAFDAWAKVQKCRLPLNHRTYSYEDQPAIFGGKSRIVLHARDSYASGDWTTWPVTVTTHVIGQNPVQVDPMEWACEHHFNGNARKQARSVDPKLGGQRKVPLDAVSVHAVIDGLFASLSCPVHVIAAVFALHPRDKDHPLYTGGTDVQRRLVHRWVWENVQAIRASTGFEVKGSPPQVPKHQNGRVQEGI